MGTIEFELRVLDPRAAPELAAAFRQQGTLDCTPHRELFAGTDPGTGAARAGFEAMAARAQGTPLGTWMLEDVWVAGTKGLVIDLERRVVWYGHVIGWPLVQVRIDVENELGGRVIDDRTVLLDERLFTAPKSVVLPDRPSATTHHWNSDPTRDDPPRRFQRLRMLAVPGISIWGHWLIDIVPRLTALIDEDPKRIYAPGARPWGNELAALFGVTLRHPALAWPGSLVHTDALELPTLLRHDEVLDGPRTKAVWEELAARICRQPLEEDVSRYGTHLYVSRAEWHLGRSLANAAEVETALVDRGFSVIHPEKLSMRAQVEVFSRAERVIGEDGSGLHNSIFAASGTHVTVLDVDRTNVFHSSIANACGQRISHLASEPVDGGHAVPVERVLNHVEQHP